MKILHTFCRSSICQ